MAETDPFGRVRGEDPLAAMGWTGDATAEPDAGPAELAPPEGRPRRRARRGRRGVGCAFALLVLLFIASVATVVVVTAVDTADEVFDSRPAPAPARSPAPDDEARAPRGLERRSLLRERNLVPALRRLRRLTRSEPLRLIRLDADSLLVQTDAGGGRTRLASASWKGDANVLSTTRGRGGATFPWSRVDPAAPERIVREAVVGTSAVEFDFLVLMTQRELGWSAFLRSGAGTFSASPDGRRVDRVG
jgi:hypothetical protein